MNDKFLFKKCTWRVPNTERKQMWDNFPLPKVPPTIPAQLDPTLKSEVADKQCASVLMLLLDSLAPITSFLGTHYKGNTQDQKQVIMAVMLDVHFNDNANVH